MRSCGCALDKRFFFVSVLCFFCFCDGLAMVSNAVDTMCFFAECSECQSGERFKQARANGSHVGLKPVLFVTQPKLQIMCLHVLRQLHRLLLVWVKWLM